ncbi:LANO_0B07382g1_1 [Lachancea nothofagi CBS 11611]|uniref:U3 small nucleolar RNA-associated protein 10 n=1 Tax=Lachancea nothofagi CBS 11611 TaxID=1266666 RepID=A0A1G4IZX7_9SACH|nr:LANO_0B07382g1_1 [Lachancea nothofagi CBS 11611]
MSLSDQLAQVAASNATVALDRKKRQKLHSSSLIYNPKTAATQDFDFIYENAVSSLEELIEIDTRFAVFQKSLFGASSVTIDRNIQTKDQVADLDNAVNLYLMLASSKWHLTPTLHATEWLVRRFQIHVHNAECLLLSTIDYYQTPVFKRILNIVKLPPLFQALSNFVRTEKSPSSLTIIKLFNDMDFLKLYIQYLSRVIQQKVTYTNQLLFTSCSFINLIAYKSNDTDGLNSLVPILLEISAKLLGSDSADCQIAAHTILVVFGTALPLKKEIVLAATETILANLTDDKARRSALISIGKLFQTLKGHGNVDQLPATLYQLFDSKFSLQYLIEYLSGPDKIVVDKFLTAYIRSVLRYDHKNLSSLVSLLKKIKLESFEMRLIIIDSIHLSEVFQEKTLLVEIFEYFISIDEDRVIKCLNSLNLDPDLFELRLTTSLFTAKEDSNTTLNHVDASKVLGANTSVEPFKDFLNKNSQYIITKITSMMIEDDEKFAKLLSLYVEAVAKKFKAGMFLSSFFTTVEGRLTFLLRVIISPATPTALRLESLSNFSKAINQIGQDSNLFSLVPILIAALYDTSKNVKLAVKKILSQISKRPFIKHYFLANKLYGNVEIPMVNPKDAEMWLKKFLEEYMVENHDFTSLVIPKKLEKVFMIFWANQAIYMPLPHAKSIFIRFVTGHKLYNSSYSSLFEQVVKEYLGQREMWEKRCSNNKTSFEKFEDSIVSIISTKEKNNTVLEFAESCLRCDHEQLAQLVSDRLLVLFPSLKLAQQQQIVKNVVDSTAENDLYYDSVGFLQSLPLSSDIFISLLSHYRINPNDDRGEFAKKRRRRSSTANKAVLQREEISHIAELHLRKLTITLEALDHVKPIGTEPLLSSLFNALSDLETLDQDGGLPVLYAQETLSSCMISTIDSMTVDSKSKLSLLRTDILVSAITASQSPQVQNKLLLVIGELAKLSPETILHSVMPIFIFMGAKTIRQDDEYSSYVVEKTIQRVVPALVQSKSAEITEEVEFLLMSFGTAFAHVPRHRRVKLFTTLVQTLGPDTALGPFLFLIAQQYSSLVNKFKIVESKSVLEFTGAFLSKFNVLEQLTGIHRYFNLLNTLSENYTEEAKSQLSSRTLFSNGVLNFSDFETLALKKNGLGFLDKIVGEDGVNYRASGSLKMRIIGALWDSSNNKQLRDEVKSKFGDVLKCTLDSLDSCNSFADLQFDSDESFSRSELDDLRNSIRENLFQLLGHVLDLLPIKDFVSATLPLISKDNNNESIKHHLILVLSSKFDLEPSESATFANEVIEALFVTIEKESKTDSIVQVSLNTLSSLIARFGDKLESSLITNSMSVASQLLLSQKMEIEISSLAVLTSAVQVLGVKSIAFYPKIVGPSIQIFKALENSESEIKEQLQLAIVLVFASMIKRIPAFLLSNLVDVLRIVFFANKVQDSVRLSVISLIVQHIDLKEVMRALSKIWLSDVSRTDDSVAISLFLSALESTVETIDKKVATSESPVFFRLLLSLFEYRSTSKFDHNTISRIEASVHGVANMYVLKLNDKVFRPLFALLVRWAFDGEGVVNNEITRIERLTAFFKFFNRLQDNLKAIVTTYFTYLLEPTIELLKSFSSGEVSNINLRRLVLNSLTSCFKFDRDEYWKSTSRFEVASESLIAQFSNIEDSVGRYLVKAISSLAVNNAGADDHNKAMNTMLISHMKSSCSSSEKLWAVKTIKTIYSKVGEGWLTLLPQLVPIIAELLEDDDENVEYEVRTGLVKVVENVLGEPFDRYLD